MIKLILDKLEVLGYEAAWRRRFCEARMSIRVSQSDSWSRWVRRERANRGNSSWGAYRSSSDAVNSDQAEVSVTKRRR